jgi:hypothetical protein
MARATHIPAKKSNPCPVCGVDDGRCRIHADSDLVLCATVGDQHSAPPGWRYTGQSKNPLWGKLYPDNRDEWTQQRRDEWKREKESKRRQIEAEQRAAQAALPSLQERHDLLSAKPRTLTQAQNADLLRRGLLQSEINDCLSRGWFRAERGGYGIAAIDPVTRLTVGGQIATDNRDPKYKWLLAGKTHLPETGENPLAFWKSPNFDPLRSAKVRFCEGFLKSLVTAIKLWRIDPQVIVIGAAGGQFGDKALARVVKALPACEDYILYPDAGAIANQAVMLGYQNLRDKLIAKPFRIRLEVAWWGQHAKGDRDCDEWNDAETVKIHSWGWFQQFYNPEFWQQTHQPTTVLNQRYLPTLELPSGGILAVDSAMGTGKTEALEALLFEFCQRHPDSIADLIGYRNGLLLQTCDRINSKGRVSIIHKHEMGKDSGGWADARSLAYCINSLDSRIDALNKAIDQGRKVLIALDEVDFILAHTLEMMRSQPKTGLEFARLLRRIGQGNGYILALQADLVGLPLDFLRELAGPDCPIQLIKNGWKGQPWNTRLISPLNKAGQPSNALSRLAAAEAASKSIESGEFPLIVTTAQVWLEKLSLATDKKILIADSNTVAAARAAGNAATPEQRLVLELFKKPKRAVAQARAAGYAAVGITTTAETGVSFDDVGFGRIIGFFPSLTSESAMQLLGRDRNPNTPRDIYATDRGADSLEGAGFNPAKIAKDWRLNTQKSAEFAKLREGLNSEELEIYDAQADQDVDILTRYAAKYQARRNADGASLFENIERRLKAAGHTVTRAAVEIGETARDTWKDAGEKIKDRNGKEFAAQQVTSVSEARELLRSGAGTREQVYSAQKTLLLESYPRLDLDAPETARRLILDQRGALLRELTNAWLLKYPDVAQEIDRACWRAHLGDRIIWQPTIKREAYKTSLTRDTGIEALIERFYQPLGGELRDYCEETPEVQEIRDRCRKNAFELRRALGYASAFGPDATGLECVQWLLRRLGYSQQRTRRTGSRGAQIYHWRVIDTNQSDRQAVEAALNLKWKELIAAQECDSGDGRSDFQGVDLSRKIGSTEIVEWYGEQFRVCDRDGDTLYLGPPSGVEITDRSLLLAVPAAEIFPVAASVNPQPATPPKSKSINPATIEIPDEIDGWKVGDMAVVGIDHLGKRDQGQIKRGDEMPVGVPGEILRFDVSTAAAMYGRTDYMIAMRFEGGRECRVGVEYLRPVKAIAA